MDPLLIMVWIIMEMDYWQQKLVTLWNYNDSGKMIFIIFLPLFISQ